DLPLRLSQHRNVLCEHWLLVPERPILLDRAGDPDRVHRREASVYFHQDVDVGTDRLADRRDVVDRRLLLPRVDERAPRIRERIELEGGEGHLEESVRGRGGSLRRLPSVPAVRVDANLLARFSAEKVIDGLVARLTDDVPERVLDAGDGAVEVHRAAPASPV